MNSKTYLGDGVYAEIVDGSVLLTTEDGISVTNKIYLELEVVDALSKYLKQQFEHKAGTA